MTSEKRERVRGDSFDWGQRNEAKQHEGTERWSKIKSQMQSKEEDANKKHEKESRK